MGGCCASGGRAEVGHTDVDGAVGELSEFGFGAGEANRGAFELAEPSKSTTFP